MSGVYYPQNLQFIMPFFLFVNQKGHKKRTGGFEFGKGLQQR